MVGQLPLMMQSLMQVAVITALGPLFGLSRIQAARSGLLLAAGGEFAFVAL